MAKKCTHPKGYDRAGHCPLCRQRKPGRPPKARTTAAPASPPRFIALTAVQDAKPAPIARASAGEPGGDRASRISAAYPAPPPEIQAEPEPEAEPEPQLEPEPEANGKTAFGYGWDWTARKITTGLDIGIGIAIDRFLDREPLDAGVEETNELVRVTAEYGEKRLGKVEAPTWIVFLIALAFFFLSKYAGAPKRTPKPATLTAGKTTQADAAVVAIKTPDVAAAAVTPEIPRQIPVVPANTGGSAEGATAGY
jgi:hypothetical protein